jgi:hypothetical protein
VPHPSLQEALVKVAQALPWAPPKLTVAKLPPHLTHVLQHLEIIRPDPRPPHATPPPGPPPDPSQGVQDDGGA